MQAICWTLIIKTVKEVRLGNKEMNQNLSKEENITLPRQFLSKMQEILQEEYEEFLISFRKERLYGLRFNPLKTDRETFLARMPFTLTPVAWAEEGFYYRQEEQPGKHPYHEAGAYYIQEPSAMAVVEALAPAPGERILDLCAAPGGKSTQIAGKMQGRGLLVSNEIIPNRAKILSQNIERMGIANAVVCKEESERLAQFFPSFFDRVLVDAPCSGEGMFRKDRAAIEEWSPEHVTMCRDRQLYILEQAASMVRPGGILVYSTCTFSVEENEAVIAAFLCAHGEFSIEETESEQFFAQPAARGKGAWLNEPPTGIEHTVRLFPHKIEGEGHFFAKLKKAGRSDAEFAKVEKTEMTEPVDLERVKAAEFADTEKFHRKGRTDRRKEKNKEQDKKQDKAGGIGLCQTFLREELGLSAQVWEQLTENGTWLSFGEHVYLLPRQMTELTGLKVLRPGLHLGTEKKNRFEPSHALALYLPPKEVKAHYEMTPAQCESYLRGETFTCDAKLQGWTLLTMDGYSFGFGKAGNGQMKNHYPKGLRK